MIHKAFDMEPLEGKDVLPVLVEGTKNLPGYWWLSAGTLLGLHRDKDFIPYDTDIDIAILGDIDREKVLPKSFVLIRTIDVEGKQYQSAYLHEATNIIFDIFNHHKWGDEYINRREEGDAIFTIPELIHPLKKLKYKGFSFPVPNDLDKYLTGWYGDWRTPVKDYKREWVRL